MVFATIGLRTPVWAIVVQAFLYGAFTSLQYTSMNTLVYADIEEKDASSASSIASTMQQMSISFGVAIGGAGHSVFRSQHALQSGRNDSRESIKL
jgi:predicted MFS family arabinose efflux permease